MIDTTAADGLAARLWEAERRIDEAVTGAADLLTAMVEARTAAGLPATVGAGAQAKAAEALTTLSTARRSVASAHAELGRLADANAVVLTGPIPKPDDPKKDGGVEAARRAA